jgi:hypothetical protein
MPMDKILNDIEGLRQQMYDLVKEKGIDHPDVLAVSQAIDLGVNEYIKLSKPDEDDKGTAPDATTSRIYVGYVIAALRRKRWTVTKIKQVVDAMREEFDLKSMEEAARIYYRWKH